MSITEALEGLWNTILDILSLFVMPDWNGVIALMPLLVFLGLIGPLITFLALGTFIYQVRKPRVKVTYEEGPKNDALVYPSGIDRCEVCRDGLTVTCPMCGVGRSASFDTCGNCGLVLRIENRGVAVRRGRPKAGGAAAA